MNQTTLELTSSRPQPADAAGAAAFEIGWDHAHHGLAPAAELLLDGTPLGQGWRAGKAVFGHRTLPAGRATRQWLALRVQAWREGIAFEAQEVTAHYIAQIHADRCPVLRSTLGGAGGRPDAAVVERLNPHAGYAAGNLATISRRAAQAWHGVDVTEAVRRARRAQESGPGAVAGLDAGAWWRLAALRSFATPLPFHQAAALPLALLPPNRVRLLGPAQGLQALVTMQFASPGFSARARALAALLPEHTLRHDFNLFVGALAPRVLEAEGGPASLRQTLEDAWLNERVQRRWQHFLLSLGEAATSALLERAAAQPLGGKRMLMHDRERATEGWALASQGRATRPPRAGFPPAPWQAPADRRSTAASRAAPACRG